MTEDCLKICRNTLSHSETCQRLFFGMGAGWHLTLTEFFDPSILETPTSDLRGAEEQPAMWIENSHRVSCAVLALESLAHSLGDDQPHPKFQAEVAVRSSSAVDAAAHWLTRRGPAEVVSAALAFLKAVCEGNAEVSARMFDLAVKFAPAVKGRTVPLHAVSTPFQFSWRPLPSDDRRLIALSSLLLERHLFGGQPWHVNEKSDTPLSTEPSDLVVLDSLLSADSSCSRMLVQFILAPPPPQDDGEVIMESPVPFGVLLLNTLLENTSRLLGFSTTSLSSLTGGSAEVGERCANVLSLVLLHGDDITRELMTALHTGHTCLSGTRVPLLTFLLTLVGKSTRVGEAGYPLAVSLLRALSSAVFSCDKAARILLDDPANLNILDIATTASESAGVPKPVQISACLFLGACYHALNDDTNEREKLSGGISKAALLSMIDGRIGLPRFTELLKLPLGQRTSKSSTLGSLFFLPSFRRFYERLVDAVMQSLFEHYSGNLDASSSSEKQIIAIQQSRIAELEAALADKRTSSPPSIVSSEMEQLKAENAQLQISLSEALTRAADYNLREEELLSLKKTILELTEDKERLRDELAQSVRKIKLLEEDLQSPVPFEKAREKRITELEARNADQLQQLWTMEAEHNKEALRIKELGLLLSSKLRALQQAVEWELDETDRSKMDVEALLADCIQVAEGCVESIAFVAGNVSDLTESAGIGTLVEREGGLARVRECIVYLAGAARERDALIDDCNVLKSQLDAEVIAKEEAEEARRAAEDEIVRIIDQSNSMRVAFEAALQSKDQNMDELRRLADERINQGSSIEKSLYDENAAFNAQCMGLQLQLQDKGSQLEDLLESKARAENELDSLTETVADLRESMIHLEHQVETLRQTSDEYLTALTSERASRVELEQSLQASQSLVEHVQGAYDALLTERGRLLSEIDSLSAEAEANRILLTQPSVQPLVANDELDRLRLETESKDNLLLDLRSELNDTNTELFALRQALMESNSSLAAKSHVEAECSNLRKEIGLVLEAKAKAEDEATALSKTVTSLKESLVNIERQMDELRKTAGSHEALDNKEALIHELERRLQIAMQKSERLQKAYDALLSEKDGLGSERDRLLSELESLKADLDANRVLQTQQTEALQSMISSDDVEMMRWELECEVRAREKLGEELEAAIAEVNRLSSSLQEAEDHKNRYQNEIASAEREFALYREQMELGMSRDREQIKELTDAHTSAVDELEVLRKQLAAQHQNSNVVSELESKRLECDQLQAEIDNSRFKIENLTNAVEAEIRAMEAFKVDYDERLRVLHEERERLIGESDLLKDKLSKEQELMKAFLEGTSKLLCQRYLLHTLTCYLTMEYLVKRCSFVSGTLLCTLTRVAAVTTSLSIHSAPVCA